MLSFLLDQSDDARTHQRTDPRQRLIAVVLALLIEAGLVLVVLSLGWTEQEPPKPTARMVSVAIEAERAAKADDTAKSAAARETPQKTPLGTPNAPSPAPAPPALVTPIQQIIPVSKDQMAQFDLSKFPRPAARPAAPGMGQMGPPDHGVPGDSRRVGTAPGGQPMYAAAWYREPYDDELRGYLATAQGPGWALIACRTAPDFRVEDCVGLDEYPSGSNLQRAVLAAAWQFRVRPPRIGGVSQVGAWVRIRIDYTERQER